MFCEIRFPQLISDKPYLFAATKGDKTYFIMGSLHFGFTIDTYPKYIIDLLSSVDALYGERSVEDALSMSNTQSNKKNKWPAHIRESLKRRGMSEDFIDYSSQREMCYWYRVQGLYSYQNIYNISLDASVQKVAQEKSIEFKSLDKDLSLREYPQCSLQQLSNLISALPPESVDESVVSVVTEMVINFLLGQDEGMSDPNESEKTFIRNEVWLKQIMKEEQSRLFIIVGAHHLAPNRPKGLLTLLRNSGFTLERLSQKNYVNYLQ